MDFSKIGLQNRDKRVYEALIDHPQSSIRKIAETTKINRGSVFESIKQLVRAGLVTQVRVGKRVVYRAKDPEVLHEIVDEKRRELFVAKKDIDRYVESFSGRADNPELFHFASSYVGDEGLAAILRDVLKTCRKHDCTGYYAISSPRVSSYLYNNFPYFTQERIRQKLFVQVLRQGRAKGEMAAFAESRFVDASSRDTGCYTLIYGTKVAIITIDGYNQTSGVIIDNQSFAEVQRQLFERTWRGAAQ